MRHRSRNYYVPPRPGIEGVTPLKRLDGPGCWRSQDGRFTFLHHHSDPPPQRWFIYDGSDLYPINEGSGITTLRDCLTFIEQYIR